MSGITVTVNSVNITAYTDVESIRWVQPATHINGTCSFDVEDSSGTVSISVGHAIDMDDDGTTLWAGEVARIRKEQRGVTKIWHVEGQDYNAYLDMAVVSHSFSAGTSDSSIINTLFTNYRSDIDSVTDVTTLDASMEAVTFTAMTLRECLDDLARRTGGRYYVDYDKDLHWFATEAASAAFDLSTSPDYSTSYPFGNFRQVDDGTRKITHVWTEGKEINGWHPATPDYSSDERHAVERDPRITTAQGVTDRGTAIYGRYSSELTTYELDCWQDGLTAGESITLVNATWSINSAFFIRKIEAQVLGKDGERRVYHLTLDDEPSDPIQSARHTDWHIAVIEDRIWEIDTLASRGWGHDMTFSATDHDTIAWTSGTITLAGGTGTFSIDAGNTGNMGAVTYIYLDADTSSTVLQTDTSASNAVGRNKILIAVAGPVAAGSNAQVAVFGGGDWPKLDLITADVIAAETITANELASNSVTTAKIQADAVEASHINASLITTDEISEFRVGSGTPGVDFTGYRFYNTYFAGVNNDTMQVYIDVSDGKFYGGGGDAWIDSLGYSVEVPDNAISVSSSYKFYYDGTLYSYLGAERIAATSYNRVELTAEDITSFNSQVQLFSHCPSGQDAWIYLRAYDDSSTVYLYVKSGNSGNFLQASHSIFINDTANANQTLGITINQGANDDEILAFKSSDVAHGITSWTETDTFALMKKYGADDGGLSIQAFTEATVGLGINAIGTTANTSKDSTAVGYALIAGYEKNGTSIGNATADANIASFHTYRGDSYVCIAFLDEDGDFYTDGSNTATYDDYDDALMCRDLAQLMAGEYDQLIRHNREAFEAAGIIGPTDEQGRFMVSTKRLRMLLLGAIGQLSRRLQLAEGKLRLLEAG